MNSPHNLNEKDDTARNDSLNGDNLWSNVNFGEAVTAPMTPLAWSVLEYSLEDWVFIPGFSTTGNICGRPYVNISIFASLFRALGRSRKELLDSLEATLYMRLPDSMEIPVIPLSAGVMPSIVAHLTKIQLKQRRGVQRMHAYLLENPAWFSKTKARLQQIDNMQELTQFWRSQIGPHIKAGAWTVLGSATYSADFTIRLRRKLAKLVDLKYANLLIANLTADLDCDGAALLPSLGPIVGLSRLANQDITREDYLLQYGHRGPHEFEISIPRPVEYPQWLDRELAELLAHPVDVQNMLAQQKDKFDAAWERFQTLHARMEGSMKRKLQESARRAYLREQCRSEYVRDRWMARLFALRAGELTSLGNDVFFLTLKELLEWEKDCNLAIRSILDRIQSHRRFCSLPSYPSIIRGAFDPFQWAADPNHRSDIYINSDQAGSLTPTPEKSSLITGSAGSSGQVEGFARVILDPANGYQLQKGEILVTVQTDIAWTLLFPRAAAVVTDVGAPLSHAAIVARELGIPAVVGCGDATSRIKTGDRIWVDGAYGIVKFIR